MDFRMIRSPFRRGGLGELNLRNLGSDVKIPQRTFGDFSSAGKVTRAGARNIPPALGAEPHPRPAAAEKKLPRSGKAPRP